MCTAIAYQTKDFYFGRNLDYEHSFGEEVVVTPRRYPFSFLHKQELNQHYALVGMACVVEGQPLYYDAINEKGLGMAGLNFVGNAYYHKPMEGKSNIATFEFIPWILGQCASVREARILLDKVSLLDTPFSEEMPAYQLHWLLADSKESVTIEAVEEGIRVYNNPVGVLTNNPPFPMQIFYLNNYMNLSNLEPLNRFSPNLLLQSYSLGMGALGLPGDLSSGSRFVRAAFVKENSVSGERELQSVSQFFHILGSVEQQRGCCKLQNGSYEITIYSSCCNASKGIYYYTTYENHQISAVDMHKENLEGDEIARYLLKTTEAVYWH